MYQEFVECELPSELRWDMGAAAHDEANKTGCGPKSCVVVVMVVWLVGGDCGMSENDSRSWIWPAADIIKETMKSIKAMSTAISKE